MSDAQDWRNLAAAVIEQAILDATWVEPERARPPTDMQARRDAENACYRAKALLWLMSNDLKDNLWIEVARPNTMTPEQWIESIQLHVLNRIPWSRCRSS